MSSTGDNYSPSGSSPINEENTPRRKRRARSSPLPQPEIKKLRSGYYKGYHRLFNEVVKDVNKQQQDKLDGLHRNQRFQSSQIGSVLWSNVEKSCFFEALERVGKDDIRAIAGAVGSKSETEVEAYIGLLQQQANNRWRQAKKQRTAGAVDMSAAIEVSLHCEEAMNEAADGLAARQTAWEESIERQKHGSLWRVDEDTDLLELLTDEVDGQPHHLPAGANVDSIRNAAEFFQLDNMMVLSRCVFMNSRDPEFNYRTYASNDQLPSMQLTSLLDLYNLIVTITKRILSTAHFMALSRLRALAFQRSTKPKALIKRADIIAALDTLGMKKSNENYLHNALRKCNVAVHQKNRRAKYALGAELPYSALEKLLVRRKHGKYKKVVSHENLETDQNPMEMDGNSIDGGLSPSEDTDEDLDSIEDPVDDAYFGSWQDSTRAGKSRIETEQQEDDYLDAIDQRCSEEEEQRLMMLISGDDLEVDTGKRPKGPAQPVPLSKSAEDLVDWRLWLGYQSQWEQFEVPVKEQAFVENRRLTARVNNGLRHHPGASPECRGRHDERLSSEKQAGSLPVSKDAKIEAAFEGRVSPQEDEDEDDHSD